MDGAQLPWEKTAQQLQEQPISNQSITLSNQASLDLMDNMCIRYGFTIVLANNSNLPTIGPGFQEKISPAKEMYTISLIGRAKPQLTISNSMFRVVAGMHLP